MLTSAGLQVKKLADMLPEVIQTMQQDIDNSISINDSDPLYQFLVIVLSEVDQLWQLAQAVSDSDNLDKAEGVFLDNLGAIAGGVIRNAAQPTTGIQYFRGQLGTVIPAGTLLENTQTKDRYFITNNLTLSTNQAREVTFSVGDVVNEAVYSVTISGDSYSYTSDTSATALEIITGIKAEMDADLNKNFTVVQSGATLRLSTNASTGMNVSSTANMSVDSVVNSATISAENTGPLVANANTVTRIVTPVGGLLSTYNPAQLSTGRNRENDADYRLRIQSSRVIEGKATVAAIKANLLNVPGVLYAAVIENDTMEEDGEGRPPKSIEAVVDGGTDEAVGETLLFVKGATTETYGNTIVNVNDADGQPHTVKFSRPNPLYIAVRVTYSVYDEEQFPEETGEASIRQAVVNYTNSLGLDKDIFPGRYFGPIYNAVQGVGTLTVETQVIPAPGTTPVEEDWSVAPIPVAQALFAQTTVSDVYVEEDEA